MAEQQNLPLREPMARMADPTTSHEAAATVWDQIGRIQRIVLLAYLREGPMTARTAERLECFEFYGFSTIRKRISELARAGILVETGVDRTGKAPATIYAACARALEVR